MRHGESSGNVDKVAVSAVFFLKWIRRDDVENKYACVRPMKMLQSVTFGPEPAAEYLEPSTRQGSALLNCVSAGSLQTPNFTFNHKCMHGS